MPLSTAPLSSSSRLRDLDCCDTRDLHVRKDPLPHLRLCLCHWGGADRRHLMRRMFCPRWEFIPLYAIRCHCIILTFLRYDIFHYVDCYFIMSASPCGTVRNNKKQINNAAEFISASLNLLHFIICSIITILDTLCPIYNFYFIVVRLSYPVK